LVDNQPAARLHWAAALDAGVPVPGSSVSRRRHAPSLPGLLRVRRAKGPPRRDDSDTAREPAAPATRPRTNSPTLLDGALRTRHNTAAPACTALDNSTARRQVGHRWGQSVARTGRSEVRSGLCRSAHRTPSAPRCRSTTPAFGAGMADGIATTDAYRNPTAIRRRPASTPPSAPRSPSRRRLLGRVIRPCCGPTESGVARRAWPTIEFGVFTARYPRTAGTPPTVRPQQRRRRGRRKCSRLTIPRSRSVPRRPSRAGFTSAQSGQSSLAPSRSSRPSMFAHSQADSRRDVPPHPAKWTTSIVATTIA